MLALSAAFGSARPGHGVVPELAVEGGAADTQLGRGETIADTARVTAAPDDAVTTRAHIDACLDELPDMFREPVVLCFLCDLDYGEIATELALPVGTVKSRIHRARAALKQCLGTSLLTAESNGW